MDCKECAICYGESGSFCKLTCGHEFCAGCIKTWCQKGTGTGCPMCRRPVYFKGFYKIRKEWDEEAWEVHTAEVFSEAIDEVIDTALTMAAGLGHRFKSFMMKELQDDLKDLDRTYRFLKSEGMCADDIEYVLMESGDYFSDHNIDKYLYDDDPVTEKVSRYPFRKSSRGSASADPWAQLPF